MDGQATEATVMHPSSSPASGVAVNDQPVAQSQGDPTITSFLTLGDGDFSYSLDLAHHLASLLDSSAAASPSTPLEGAVFTKNNPALLRYHLIATGIDSHDELVQKYKDGPFFIKHLRLMNHKQQKSQGNDESSQHPAIPHQLCVRIHHGVNAIVTEDAATSETSASAEAPKMPSVSLTMFLSDHVIFNHPHLGKEDAELHSRFLHHLFHSASECWMKPNGGIFHLALVEGQYERWKCKDAAKCNGLVLLERNQFRPPPTAALQRSYYQYRRHQTGKSFESRRTQGGSWTYTFGRISDQNMYVATCLPWQQTTATTTDSVHDATKGSNEQDRSQTQPTLATPNSGILSCPYCNKNFAEERSRKCHVRDKHRQQATEEELNATSSKRKKKKQRRNESQSNQVEIVTKQQQQPKPEEFYYCEICAQPPDNSVNEAGNEQRQHRRKFTSLQGLQDHVRAVHTARHKNILPDWAKNNKNAAVATTTNTTTNGGSAAIPDQQEVDDGSGNRGDFGSCGVCGLVFRNKIHSEQHRNEFVPRPVTHSEGGGRTAKWQCSFCSKTFREDRARKQHENFCPLQTEITN